MISPKRKHATGTGKTITAVSDAKKVGKRTLFLAHTKELVKQAKGDLESAWSEVACGMCQHTEYKFKFRTV